MLKEEIRLGDPQAKDVLVQITGEDETSFLEKEFHEICRLCGRQDLQLIALPVTDWNRDLSPWEAEAVFGSEGFGGGAEETLEELLGRMERLRGDVSSGASFYLGGYSLAGLFVLWTVCREKGFRGAAAASPSVWFPGFTDYLKEHPARTDSVYLSLGLKEEKTRHPVMRTVGDAIRASKEILDAKKIRNTLEWNPGNHFLDPDLRMAKGFAWLLQNTL